MKSYDQVTRERDAAVKERDALRDSEAEWQRRGDRALVAEARVAELAEQGLRDERQWHKDKAELETRVAEAEKASDEKAEALAAAASSFWMDRAHKAEARVEQLTEALNEIAATKYWLTRHSDEVWRIRKVARAVLVGDSTPGEPICICPRFTDLTEGTIIADLTCPVHGVDGTAPGDVLVG